jgi:hypothetical protein
VITESLGHATAAAGLLAGAYVDPLARSAARAAARIVSEVAIF